MLHLCYDIIQDKNGTHLTSVILVLCSNSLIIFGLSQHQVVLISHYFNSQKET